MRKVNLKSMFLALFLLHIILVSSITATSGSYTVVIPSFSQHGSLLQGKKSSATDFTATHFISGMGGTTMNCSLGLIDIIQTPQTGKLSLIDPCV